MFLYTYRAASVYTPNTVRVYAPSGEYFNCQYTGSYSSSYGHGYGAGWCRYTPDYTTAQLDLGFSVSNMPSSLAISWYTWRPESGGTLSSNWGSNSSTTSTVGSVDLVAGGVIWGVSIHPSALTSITSNSGTAPVVSPGLNFPVGTSASVMAPFYSTSDTGSSYPTYTATGTSGNRGMFIISFGQQDNINVTAAEAINMAQTSGGTNWKQGFALADQADIGSFALHTMPQFLTATETNGIGVNNTYALQLRFSMVEATSVVGELSSRVFGTFSDIGGIGAIPTMAGVANAVDAFSTGEALSYVYKLGPVMIEGAKITEALGSKYTGLIVVTERSTYRDVVAVAVPVALTQAMQIAQVSATVRALNVVDQLKLTDVLVPQTSFRPTMSEYATVSDALRRFFGGGIVETFAVTETLTRLKSATASSTDNVGIADALSRKIVFRVTSENGVALDDMDVLKWLFKPTLADEFEVTAAYINPGNTVTTWSINTKNFATTEYTNFDFNSFAQLGNRYLGATRTGLYELDGDTDAGASIIADIKSGLMQLGGSRFTSFKAAYLGMRGTGDFVLKLETGDGTIYNYAVVGKNMQSTKVHFGKGLRARYFSFELISTGQDFDLDSIEFIPLVAQRRV